MEKNIDYKNLYIKYKVKYLTLRGQDDSNKQSKEYTDASTSPIEPIVTSEQLEPIVTSEPTEPTVLSEPTEQIVLSEPNEQIVLSEPT